MAFNPLAGAPPAAKPDADAADGQGLSRMDIFSIVSTLALGVGLAVLASLSARHNWVLWLAVSVGGLGGLVHEIAQSGGKILFFERKLDGIYIGSLAGMILGAVAGLLAIRGLIINTPEQPDSIQLIYEAFLAGLALKGVAEAAGGQALPAGSNSVTPGQALAAEASLNKLASEQPPSPTPSTSSQPLPSPPSTLPPSD